MKRLHSLDALRGLAALCVVLWHWQHFFAMSGTWPIGWQRSAQPLYPLLKPLYEDGWMAVDLFFALSGFVFFWLYAEAIRNQAIGAGKFALLRFSRLYPLHVFTLLIVATLQMMFHRTTGQFFIYDVNDLTAFLLNLGFVQGWRPDAVQSFNGPAWSVSVEVLLYLLFFLIARKALARPAVALVMVAIGLAFMPLNFQVARGIIGFFCGGLAWFAVAHVTAEAGRKWQARWIIAVAFFAWAAALIASYAPVGPNLYSALNARVPSGMLQGYAAQAPLLIFSLFVSPLTIMALALHERLWRVKIYTRASFLGEISYSTYMLQFPLQLAVALFTLYFGLRPTAFQSPWSIAAFLAVLITLSALCYRGFERPMQRWRRAVKRAKSKPAVTPAAFS